MLAGRLHHCCGIHSMFKGNGKSEGSAGHSRADDNRQYAWKERSYVVPRSSRKGFQWKASALRTLQRLHKSRISGRPVTIVVPALFNLMPAEALALGWLNEIDALGAIRHRIAAASNV